MHDIHAKFFFLNRFLQLSVTGDALNFCKVPFLVAERTYGTRFQPSLNAVQVENMPTVTERYTEPVIVRR
jgi:hypothetical protein